MWQLAKALPPAACTAEMNQVLKAVSVHDNVIGCVCALNSRCSELSWHFAEILCLFVSKCSQDGMSRQEAAEGPCVPHWCPGTHAAATESEMGVTLLQSACGDTL